MLAAGLVFFKKRLIPVLYMVKGSIPRRDSNLQYVSLFQFRDKRSGNIGFDNYEKTLNQNSYCLFTQVTDVMRLRLDAKCTFDLRNSYQSIKAEISTKQKSNAFPK